jgi:peroxiredoxin
MNHRPICRASTIAMTVWASLFTLAAARGREPRDGPVADQFQGRLDLAKHNGDDSGELPLGATYIIDHERMIPYAFIDADYRERAEPSDVIAVLRRLKEQP